MSSRSDNVLFSDKYEVSPSGCWNWLGCLDKDGYGLTRLDGRRIRAHRASYILHRGDISEGGHVCHDCDNPSCVNPDHLWIGTHSDNMRDAYKKGRKLPPALLSPETVSRGEKHSSVMKKAAAKGEGAGNSTLTADQVREIRRLHVPKKKGINVELAAKFDVSVSSIEKIVKRVTWKHI